MKVHEKAIKIEMFHHPRRDKVCQSEELSDLQQPFTLMHKHPPTWRTFPTSYLLVLPSLKHVSTNLKPFLCWSGMFQYIKQSNVQDRECGVLQEVVLGTTRRGHVDSICSRKKNHVPTAEQSQRIPWTLRSSVQPCTLLFSALDYKDDSFDHKCYPPRPNVT